MTHEPMFLPEGIAGPDGRTGYIAAEAGGIDTIDLDNGSLLWHTRAASRPLLVSGNHLIAQSPIPGQPNALRIVILDVSRNGELVLTSEPIVFPEWVDVNAANPEVFQYRVCLDGRALVLNWEAHARYAGGAPPSQQVLRQARRDAAGAVHVDLQTGRVTMRPSASSAVPCRADILREAASPPTSPEIVWQSEPWQVGDRLVALIMKEIGDALALLLQSKRSGPGGEAETQIELARGAGFVPSVSPDGRHVFVESDVSAVGATDGQRLWQIFETETGQLVAAVPYEDGARELGIVGSRLFYIVQEPSQLVPGENFQKVLRARSLPSGALLWERVLSTHRATRAPRLPA